MSLMRTKLTTCWTPAQACDILELLDDLRDQLWETHGDRIIEYRLSERSNVTFDERQKNLEFDDELF